MSKSYRVDRANGDQELDNESRIKVYSGVSEILADIENLEEDQIIGVVSNTDIPQPNDPEDGSVVYWSDSLSEYTATPGPTVSNTVLTAKVSDEGEVSYEWKSGGSGSVNVFDTLAEAEAALEIPEGTDGYIPNNGIVIVKNEMQYLEGESR